MASEGTVARNGRDTHVSSTNPSENRADARQLRVQSGVQYAYLWFNRPFPLDATIPLGMLRVYAKGVWGVAPTLTVHRISEPWRVHRTTWNNRPQVAGAGISVTQSSAVDGDEWAFDLTSMLQTVADGGAWWGVRITTDHASSLQLYSANGPDEFAPVLEVEWSEAPQPPSVLRPAGDRAVGVSHPVLRFDFTDEAGSQALQAVQVQVDPDGTFGSGAPGVVSATAAFDTGPLAATEPELDLAATAYAGLADGASTRWRVAVQDAAGLWSDWSDPATFHRTVKGTLTVTNPAAAPNDFVSEWTPPISWSLTGAVQTAWRVFVTPADDPTDRLYDTGWTKGADTSWTLPKAIIEDDSTYRVVVRVRDADDREHTPDDPTYTQAERTFTFREDPTTNPVTSLAAVSLSPRPWVELTWDRATAPDYFTIKRDGQVVETRLEAVDLLVSGTSYRYVDKDAAPYRTHTWRVQATAGGDTSGNNPEVSLRVEQQGIWVTSTERDIDVFIAGDDPGAWDMPEEGTTHYPMGASQPVRIMQALRGYETELSGRFITKFGVSAETWERRMFTLKENPDEPVIVSCGDTSVRCRIYNIVSTPTPTVPITRVVSFRLHQVGRLPFRSRI